MFITNVVKCRPPGNRDPEADEIAACAPYLRRQLEVLDPAVVVTLGRFSMQAFIPGARIGQVHGTTHPVDPGTGAAAALAFAMYHPAAALRSSGVEQTSFEDVARVPVRAAPGPRAPRRIAGAGRHDRRDRRATGHHRPRHRPAPPRPHPRPVPRTPAAVAAEPAPDDASQLTLF